MTRDSWFFLLGTLYISAVDQRFYKEKITLHFKMSRINRELTSCNTDVNR